MNISRKTHIVFDLDDTLTDSYLFNQDLFIETFRPYLPKINSVTVSYLRRLHLISRGKSMLDQFAQAINHLHLSLKPEVLVAENELLHTQKAQFIKIYPYTRHLLGQLKKSGKTLSVCTNRQSRSLHQILQTNRVSGYFTQIVSCSDQGHEKPDPYCLNSLVDYFRLSKDRFLYIGDSATDRLFAQNADIDFLLASLWCRI